MMKIDYLKYIKPYYRWEIDTNIDIYEVRSLLRNNLKPFQDKYEKSEKEEVDFVGELKNNGFIFENNTWNTFGNVKPQILGELTPLGDGSKLRAEFIFTYSTFLKSLLITFALIIAHSFLVTLVIPEAELPRDEIVFFSTVIFLVMFIPAYLNFWLETLNSIASFRIILKGHII